MANNKFSASCITISSFDTYVKENYFPTKSNGGVCNIRGTIMDIAPNKEEFSPERIEEITTKLDKKVSLSQEDKAFIEKYVKNAKVLLKEKDFKSKLEERLARAGIKRNATSLMYTTYKAKFPAEHRADILSQVVAATITLLDNLEQLEDFKHYTRAEIIEDIGIANMMTEVRDTLKRSFDSIENPSEIQKSIADTLFSDQEALEALFYMARTKLFEAEKLKVGIEENKVEEEDEGTPIGSDEIQDAETQGPEHWMLKSDTISSFNSMSRENRSILYKLVGNKVGILGLPSIVDTMLIHQQLMELRGENNCTNSSEFLEALNKLDKNKCPWAAQLYKLLKDNSYRRTSFFNVYRRNHLNYNALRRDFSSTTGGPIYYENNNKADPKISYQAYVAQIYDIKDPNKCLFDRNGNIKREAVFHLQKLLLESQTINGIELPSVYQRPTIGSKGAYFIEYWNPSIGKDPLHPTKEEIQEKKRDFIIKMNDYLNLHMDSIEIDDLMEKGKFDKFMKATIKIITTDMTKATRVSTLLDNNRSFSHIQAMVAVAKPIVSLAERKSPVEKTFRFNKSTYVTHTVCNHVGDLMERISKAAKEAIDKNDITVWRKFIEDTFLKCRVYALNNNGKYEIYNEWVKQLYESELKDLKSENSFATKFTKNLERAVGMDEKNFEDFVERENYILCLNSYLNTRKDTGGKFGRFPLFVTGDSNSTRFLTAPIMQENEIKKALVNVAKQEIERMQMFQDLIDWCTKNGYNPPKNVVKNASSFTILKFLEDHKGSLISSYKGKDLQKFEEQAEKLIEAYLSKGFNQWVDNLRKEGENSIVNMASPTINKQVLTVEGMNLDTDHSILKEYYLNYKLATIQQFQILTVDQGFYDGTNDMQKRYKEMIAAGTPLDLEAVDPSDSTKKIDDNNGKQDVIYIQEQFFPTNVEALDALQEAKGRDGKPLFNTSKLKESTSTDGQAWRSFTSYRKIMVMLGKWSPEMEEVWKIIQNARKEAKLRGITSKEYLIQSKDIEKIFALGVVFQPIKPFYYGIEKISTNGGQSEVHIPVQHKCSEFPIIPELLPDGSPLAALGEALEDNSNGRKSYDLAICTSAVKVGNFGSANIKDLNNSSSIREALDKGYRHELSLDGWREQSGVPEHADCSRALGTQLRLHWLSNLAGTAAKKYPFLKKVFPSGKIKFTSSSEPIDIKDGLNEGTLLQLYNHVASNGFIKSSINLINELSNPNKMSDLLSNLKANDNKEANDGIDAYTTDESGEFKISPSEGISAKDNVAALLSYIRKKIIKQGMKGGSLVQVSTYGFQDVLKVHTEKTQDNKNNITYADCVTCFNLSITKEDGSLLKLNYTDYVDFKTGNLLKADGTAFSDAEIEELEKNGVDWRKQSKLETEYPGILDMLAYRIPTEGHCSVLNLKVRKFLPLTAGATIIVPAFYTAIAGFDFDIDKLYFVRREYKEKKLSKTQKRQRINKIWNDIYGKPDNKSKGNSDIYKRLVAARKKAEEKKASEPDRVVATSSNFQSTTFADLIGEETIQQMYESTGLTDSNEIAQEILDTTDEDIFTEDDRLTEEERKAQEDNIEEAEFLYQYWDLAGLNKPVNEGGKGMSASEYFENFVAEHSKNYISLQKYDERKSLLQQPQAVINNLLFELYQARLEDYDTFQERYTPSGFQNLKNAKPVMLAIRYADKEDLEKCDTFEKLYNLGKEKFKDYSLPYDATEISTLVHYQTQNALYDKLIGISANQNINQKYTSLVEKLKLKSPIKWGSMLDSSDSAMGCDVKKRFMNTVDPVTNLPVVLDTESSSKENLAASVDAVKDALLEFFGITNKNFNIASFMGKIGATPYDIGLLLNQPITREAMRIIESERRFMTLSEALYKALEILSDKDTASYMINEVLPTMKSSRKEDTTISTRDKYVSLDALTRSIAFHASGSRQSEGKDEFLKTQVAIISLLQELQAAATVLSDEINITKSTSVNSVQSDFGSVEATEQRAVSFALQQTDVNFPFELEVTSVNSELTHTVIDPYARIIPNHEEEFIQKFMQSSFGIAQTAYSAVMSFVDLVMSKYFPYRSTGFTHFKNVLSNFTNKNKLNADIINAVNKFLPMYCLEKMVPMFMENAKPVVAIGESNITLDIPNRVFYKEYFATFFMEILTYNKAMQEASKDTIDYSKIPILSYITPERQKLHRGYANSQLILKAETIGSLKKEQKDVLIESWEQMFKSDDPILRNLAIHLFMYSYYVGGFDFGPLTFMSLAPLAIKTALGIDENNPNASYAQFYNRLFNLHVAQNSAYLEETGSISDSSISIKEAIKAFLANNCITFTQFSRIIYNTKKDDLYDAINPLFENNNNKFTVDFTDKSISDAHKLALKSLITETFSSSDGKTVTYKVKPCVVIKENGTYSIYICDINWNNNDVTNFNICSGRITYYKIDTPIGVDNSDVKLTTETVDTSEKYNKAYSEMTAQLQAQLFEAQENQRLQSMTLQEIEDASETEENLSAKIRQQLKFRLQNLYITLAINIANSNRNDKTDYIEKLTEVFQDLIYRIDHSTLSLQSVENFLSDFQKIIKSEEIEKIKTKDGFIAGNIDEVYNYLNELKESVSKESLQLPDVNNVLDLHITYFDLAYKTLISIISQSGIRDSFAISSGLENMKDALYKDLHTVLRNEGNSTDTLNILENGLEELKNRIDVKNNTAMITKINEVETALENIKKAKANESVITQYEEADNPLKNPDAAETIDTTCK